MTDETKSTLLSFLAALTKEPDCDTTALVLCDFLDEQGIHTLSQCIRASILFKQEGSKIYVVTSGSYSDYSYSIRGIFTTREHAQRYIDAGKAGLYDDYNEIEKSTLNENIPLLLSGLQPYEVTMRLDGNNAQVEKASASTPLQDRGIYRQKTPNDDYAVFTTTVWSKSEEGAIKIANERRIAAAVDPEQQEKLKSIGKMITRMASYRAAQQNKKRLPKP